MDDDQLREVFRRAAELSESVPEPLREAAFNRAVDALLGATKHSDKGETTSARPAPSAKAHKQKKQSSDTDETVEEILHQIDRTAYPELQRASRALDRALIVLYAANKDAGVDGLTSSDIERILKEKFRVPHAQSNQGAIRIALDRAGDLVDRDNRSGKLYFKLMAPGEAQVEALRNQGEDAGNDKSQGTASPASKRPRRTGGSKTRESYSLDRNLNLRGSSDVPPFRDFYASKNPGNLPEFNAVAVYYLEKLMGIQPVTLDHVFTCYREVNKRVPVAFRQSFVDARGRYGLLDMNSEGELSIPHRGVNFVEHDLPRAQAAKKKNKKS